MTTLPPSRAGKRLQLAAAGLALAIAMLVLVAIEYMKERETLLDMLLSQARIVGDSSAPALMFDDPASARASLAALSPVTAIRAAALYGANSPGHEFVPFAEYHAPGDDHPFPAHGRPTAALKHFGVTLPLFVEGREIGILYLIADHRVLFLRVGRYFVTVLATALASLALAYLLTGGLRRRVAETEKLLETRAHFDELTSLPNRSLFNDRIAHALALAERRHTPLALLFFDLDDFKVINDSLGHDAGDRLLTLAARRLREAMREADTVCRLGGDEFVAILENGSEGAAARVARHIMGVLSSPYTLDGRETSVRTSIGIAIYPRDGTDAGQLLRAADTALYAAKSAGKGEFRFFSAELDRLAHERMELESGLRRALSQGEFSLHYQVQVDARTRAMTGAEALLRWKSPVFGDVPPSRFIPVAEASGLIREIGAWVLKEACRQAGEWIARAPDFVMAVNVSARQWNDPGLADQVRDCLARYGLPPRQLELEITESALLGNAPEVLDNLRALDALDVRFGLDDFGTGYSSLAYLKRLPIGRLKIDRSFIHHLPDDADDAAIVVAILSLSGALGMEVVGEGVESEAQLAFLRAAGCAFAQGWLFDRAVPAEEFERRWLPAAADPAPVPACRIVAADNAP